MEKLLKVAVAQTEIQENQYEVNIENAFNPENKISMSLARTSRYPNASERFFNFDSLFGNDKLVNEEHVTAAFRYEGILFSEIDLNLSANYNFITDEIIFNNPNFENGPDRDYLTTSFELGFNFWKLYLSRCIIR